MNRRKSDVLKILRKIAVQHGVSVDEVERDILETIDAAWNDADPSVRTRQQELFPNGKPTVEVFIRKMAEQIR